MHRLVPSLVAFAAVIVHSPASAMDSTVDRVTIYPGQLATLERTVRVDVESGTGSLELTGLASALETDSVQVEVTSGDLTVGAVETATENVEFKVPRALREPA